MTETTSTVRGWILLYLLLSSQYTDSLQIIDSYTTVQVVNGHARNLHRTTFQCNEYDANQPATYTVTDTSGVVRTVEVTCNPITLHYDQELVGTIPEVLQPMSSKVCLSLLPSNTSMLPTLEGNPVPSPYSTDFNTNDNGFQRRRLLTIGDLKEHLDELRKAESASALRQPLIQGPEDRYFDSRPWVHDEETAALNDVAKDILVAGAQGRRLLGLFSGLGSSGKGLFKGSSTADSLGQFAALYGVYKYTFPAIKRFRTRYKASKAKKAKREQAQKEEPAEEPKLSPASEADAEEAEAAGAAEENAVISADTAAGSAAATGAEEGTISIFVEEGAAGVAGPIMLGIGVIMLANFAGGFGGGNVKAIKAIVNAMRNTINDMQGHLNLLDNFVVNTKQFEASVNNRFAEQSVINDHLQSQIDDDRDAISYTQQAVSRNARAINIVENSTMRDFRLIENSINNNIVETNILWNVTRDIHRETEKNMAKLVRQVQKTAWQVRDTETTMEHMLRQTNMRRALIKQFFRAKSADLGITVEPLLATEGTPPIDLTEYNRLKTPNGAVSLGSVFLMRTADIGGTFYAQQFNLTFVCDATFIVNEIVPGMDFQTLFSWVGPAGCAATSGDAPWNCSCAIKVENKQCELAGTHHPSDYSAHAFPWKWPGATDMVADPTVDLVNTADTHCQGSPRITGMSGGQYPAGLDPGKGPILAYDYPNGYLHTPDEIANWINLVCTDPNVQAEPGGSAKVRLFGDLFPRYIDLSLSASGDPDICQGSFAGLLDTPLSVNRLSFNIYTIMSKNYRAALATSLSTLESDLYGVLPQGLTFTEEPFNANQRTGQSFRCASFFYLNTRPYAGGNCLNTVEPGINCEKVRLYRNTFVTQGGSLVVKVDGTEITNSSADPASSEGQQRDLSAYISAEGPDQVARMTSQVQVDIPSRNLLPSTFLKAGISPGRYLDPTHSLVYDAPFSTFSGQGLAQARLGKTDYFFTPWIYENNQTTGIDTPYRLNTWQILYMTDFDARFQGPSLHLYKRRTEKNPTPVIDALAEFDLFCNERYGADGTTLLSPLINYDWCQILRAFTVEPVNSANTADGQTGLIFRPRTYLYTATVETPGGIWTSRITSHCPSAISVSYTDGVGSFLTLNTSSPDTLTVQVKVQNATKNPDCDVDLGHVTYSARRPFSSSNIPYDAACFPQYFQVYTIDNGHPCYEDPGKPLGATYLHFEGNIPSDVVHRVKTLQDNTLRDIIDQTNSVAELGWEIADIRMTAANDAEVDSRIQALQASREADIDKMRTNDAASQQHVEELKKQTQGLLARAAAKIKASRDQAAYTKLLEKQLEQNNVKAKAAEAVMDNLVDQITADGARDRKANKQMNKIVDEQLKQLDEDSLGCNSGGFLGFLTAIPCALTKGLGNLMGSFLKPVIFIVIALVVFCVIFACLSQSPSFMAHCAGGSKGGYQTVYQPVPTAAPPPYGYGQSPQPAHPPPSQRPWHHTFTDHNLPEIPNAGGSTGSATRTASKAPQGKTKAPPKPNPVLGTQ